MAPVSRPSGILCDWKECNVRQDETVRNNGRGGLFSETLCSIGSS